jgi:flavin reductase (DIM6/NTAB) family NADH-FMN oxidoreductase RutF
VPVDPTLLRDVLACFPSGVAAVTATGPDNRPHGLTVSAYCPVSLAPPLVLVCVDHASNTLPAILHAAGFTVNVLAAGREELARRFASKTSEKFAGVHWVAPAARGAGPVLHKDAVAFLACRLRDSFKAGDHLVLIGEVVAAKAFGGEPLLYVQRSFARLGEPIAG